VEQGDGSTAFYAHLMQWGVDVEVGDLVAQGQRIAASGTSAVPIPLLHLGVYRSYPPQEGGDLPITFRNSEGELDDRGGLQRGVAYLALPY
jgi:murein DD-endopeptidase MepM/ murein hydrolase activator NlpD